MAVPLSGKDCRQFEIKVTDGPWFLLHNHLMIILKVLPGVLKELVKHVPTVLFQTVEWSELASELPKISRRIISKDGYDDLYQSQKLLLDPYNIILTNEALKAPLQQDRWTGEKILTLYFAQLFSSDGLFLDLRSSHFTDERPALKWHPTGFWTRFEDGFRLGLLNVYEGFYLERDDLYFEGLEQIGLLKKEFSEEDKKELGDLFRAHFGAGLTHDMRFDLENFKNSIIKMSEFMLNKKVRISKDFLYLGIYLVTLYSNLEETGAELPVKNIYLDVRARFISGEPR